MTVLRSSLRSSIVALALGAFVIASSPTADAQTMGTAKPPATAKPTATPAAPSKPAATPTATSSTGPAKPGATPTATSSTAPAKPPVSAERAAIKAAAADLFDRGAKAMEEERWEDCRASFLAAYRIDSYYQIAGSLAVCEAKLGRTAEAVEHVKYALGAMPETAPAERRASAEKLLSELRPKVSEVTIRTNKAGAEVFLDGRSLGRSPLSGPVFLEAGAHKVEAKLEGATAHAEVTATGGGTQEVTVPFEEPKKVEPPSRSLVPAFVIGGVGVASLIAGGVLLGVSTAIHDDVTAKLPHDANGAPLCQRPPVTGVDRPECEPLRARTADANLFGNAGIVSLVAGGVVVAGGVLYAVWPTARSAQSRDIRVAPVVGGSGGALLVVGKF